MPRYGPEGCSAYLKSYKIEKDQKRNPASKMVISCGRACELPSTTLLGKGDEFAEATQIVKYLDKNCKNPRAER